MEKIKDFAVKIWAKTKETAARAWAKTKEVEKRVGAVLKTAFSDAAFREKFIVFAVTAALFFFGVIGYFVGLKQKAENRPTVFEPSSVAEWEAGL